MNDSVVASDLLEQLCEVVASVGARNHLMDEERHRSRVLLTRAMDADPEATDRTLAQLWQAATAVFRQQGLRDLVDELVIGEALVAALIATIEDGDAMSGQTAVYLLRNCRLPELDEAAWRRLSAVAWRERSKPLPDVPVAALISELGPQS